MATKLIIAIGLASLVAIATMRHAELPIRAKAIGAVHVVRDVKLRTESCPASATGVKAAANDPGDPALASSTLTGLTTVNTAVGDPYGGSGTSTDPYEGASVVDVYGAATTDVYGGTTNVYGSRREKRAKK